MKKLKKRILIIGLTERIGGVETFIYNTIKFSNKDKYEYDYLVHGANECVFQREIEEFYGNNEHIFFIRKYKADPIGCLKDLYHFYKEHGKTYNFVHLQTGATSEVLYLFPFCLFFKFKTIIHSHNGNGYSPKVNKLFRPIVNMVAYKRLACSAVAAEWLFGKKGNTAQIINNGIDVVKFSFNNGDRCRIRKEYGLSDEFVIGHIGRFSEQKNHKFLLEIFAEIKKQCPKAILMLVGVGELQKEVRNYCKQISVQDSVIFCGKQMDTHAYYSTFDAFLMPSLYEGLPIVGIEAQSEGLPCFFSSNISEQIKITDNVKVLSLQDSIKKWAECILEIRKKISNREKYAKEIMEKGYSIQGTVRELEKVYGV